MDSCEVRVNPGGDSLSLLPRGRQCDPLIRADAVVRSAGNCVVRNTGNGEGMMPADSVEYLYLG